MDVKDIIRNRRIEMGLTMKELAKMVGVSEGTVSRWESGQIENMRRNKVAQLSRVLGIPSEVIMGWENDTDRFASFADWFNSVHQKLSEATTTTYPLLGEVACGEPIITNNEYEVLSSGARIEADAVVIARGDSMIGARIYDGDVVFLRYQEEIENGEIAVVVVISEDTYDAEVCLKRYYKYSNFIVLRSENPEYKDMEFHEEEMNRVHLIGKAIVVQSNLK